MINVCNKIIEYSFYALFFLVPLVIAGDTSELFEFNKMWLTYGVALIIAASWFTKMIIQRQIQIQKTPLDIPILLFLLSQFISTIFSWDMHVSFWGYYSRFNGGLLSILTYIFLYYAFVSYLGYLGNLGNLVNRFLFVSLLSGAIVALWGLPSHFGHDPTCFLFRHGFDVSCWTEDFQPKARIFSTLGQPDWLAAYLAILLPISIVMILNNLQSQNTHDKKYQVSSIMYYVSKKTFILNTLYLILATLFYLDLLYTQSRSGVIATWASVGLLFIGCVWIRKKLFRQLLILLVLFVAITFFIGTPITQLYKFTYPGLKTQIENKISQNPESKPTKLEQPAKEPAHIGEFGGTDSGKIRSIVWKGAIEIWKNNPIFGTGVETFAYAYYRYKLPMHNLTSEWNFLYNKAHNEFLNYLATTGAFGLGTYIIMIAVFLWLALTKNTNLFANFAKKLATIREKQELKSPQNNVIILALLSSYISILVTNFFGFSVVITNIYLFMIPAFVFVLAGMINPKKQFMFPRNESITAKISLYQRTFIIVLLFAICYLLFTLIKFWLADKDYGLGYNLDRAGEYVKAYPYLHKAVEKRGEPVFKDELAINDAILAVAMLTQKDSAGNKEDLKTKANNLAQEAIETSDQLTTDHENNVVFWKTRVRIFYTLSQVDQRFLAKALDAIKKASTLAPNDASISYNLGVLSGQNNDLQKGMEALERTVKLKPNYYEAHYALGLFYHEAAIDKNGKVINSDLQKKAVSEMEFILNNISPDDKSVRNALKSWEKR